MDQYKNYNRLPILLKRFPFADKMSRLFYTSQHAQKLWISGSTPEKAKSYLPWILEQLCMLFIDSVNEYGHQNLDTKTFRKIYNTVDDQAAEYLLSKDKENFTSYALQEIALTQFKVSQYHAILWYRHNYFFEYCNENIDLKTIFINTFSSSYIDFVEMAYACDVLANMPDAHKHWRTYEYIFRNCYPQCMPTLSTSREHYIELNKKYSHDNIANYSYCVRPSYQYAFILENNSLFFPLPHLLTQNITSGFMYRLTDGNNKLRDDIGKYVLEDYLFNIINGSNSYSEVFKEIKYDSIQGGNAKSPDVLAKNNNDIILFECKSTVPRMGIRWLDQEEIDKQTSILAKQIKQIYNQMNCFDRYNPFIQKTYCRDCLWGIVVLQEDPYISRRAIYSEAANLLSIPLESDEYHWLVRHIKVVDLYVIESIHLLGRNCIHELKEMTDEKRIYDIVFPSPPSNNALLATDYHNFLDQHYKWAGKLNDMLKRGGYLK